MTPRPVPAAAAAAAILFGLEAAPGLTWLDAGELGAAAWELGVAHPPGFPVFATLHKLVMLLLPIGDVAFRGNLASGLLAAVAVGLTAAAARALGCRAGAAVGGAGLTALSGIYLLHAGTIEVYSGAAAFTALLLLAWARHRASGDARWAAALGLCAGLALGHHAELRLFAALLVVAALAGRGRRRLLVPLALAGIAGALCVAYLPLRAAAEPWRNWGAPASLEALWHHLMGTRIRLAYADRFGHFSTDDLLLFAEQVFTAGPLLVVLGLPGLVGLARRPGGWAVAAVGLLDLGYATALNPMGLVDLQNGVPLLVVLGLGTAMTADGALARLEGGPRRWAGPAVAAGVVLAGALWALPHLGRTANDRGLPALLAAGADRLPPEALLLVASDNLAAGWAFAQVVEGARPDVAVVVRQHVWDPSSVEPVRARLPEALRGWRAGGGLAALERLRDGWPVAWEWAADADAAARPRDLAPAFPYFARGLVTDDPGFAPALEALLAHLPAEALTEPQARRAFAGLLGDLGRWRLGRRLPTGLAVFRRAAELAPEVSARWADLGVAFSAAGDVAAAIEATRPALALDPRNRTARVNLVRYLLQRPGDPAALAEAEAHLALLLDEQPADADALALRGVVRANAGDLDGAERDFRQALAVDAAQPEARAGLTRLLSRPRP